MSTFELDSALGIFMGTISFHWGPHEDEPTIIANQLDTLEFALMDFELPMIAAKQIVIEDMERRFAAQEGLDGKKWKKRSPATIAYYKKHGMTYSTILKKDNHLYDAVTDNSSYDIVENDLFINTSNWPVYWHVHDQGGYVGRGVKIPARPFVGVSVGAQFAIRDIFDDYLDQSLRIVRPGASGVPMYRGALGRFGGKITMKMPRKAIPALGQPALSPKDFR